LLSEVFEVFAEFSKTSKICRSPEMRGLCREGSTNPTETSHLGRVLKDLEVL
jgi:hypothetical protein